jgi:hypothetical protein
MRQGRIWPQLQRARKALPGAQCQRAFLRWWRLIDCHTPHRQASQRRMTLQIEVAQVGPHSRRQPRHCQQPRQRQHKR